MKLAVLHFSDEGTFGGRSVDRTRHWRATVHRIGDSSSYVRSIHKNPLHSAKASHRMDIYPVSPLQPCLCPHIPLHRRRNISRILWGSGACPAHCRHCTLKYLGNWDICRTRGRLGKPKLRRDQTGRFHRCRRTRNSCPRCRRMYPGPRMRRKDRASLIRCTPCI